MILRKVSERRTRSTKIRTLAWTEVYSNHQRHRRDEGRPQLETPCDITDLVDCQVGTKAEKDAKGGPHLPTHHQPTTDGGGAVFGGVNGNHGRLTAHPHTQEQTCHEELLPRLGAPGPDDGEETEDGRDEDGASSAEIVVQRVGAPATEEGRGDIRRRIDQTDEPIVTLLIRSSRSFALADPERNGEGEIGTVGTGLIPTLHCRPDGTEDDGHIQSLGLPPFVQELVAEGIALRVVEFFDRLERRRVLGDEGAFFHQGDSVDHVNLPRKLLDIAEKRFARYTRQGVLNPARMRLAAAHDMVESFRD